MEQPSLPEWATKEFFELCLRKEENNPNIIVTDLNVSSVVPPGNNYGSFIIRIELKWKGSKDDSELKTSRFIVKAEVTEGPMQEMLTVFAMNEPSFYYKFIPKAKLFGETNFAAKCFFSPKSNVTILEDLSEKGFVMADRTKQLDFDHCRLYMIAAASFHSVSVPVFKKYPELLEPINKELLFSHESKTKDIFILMIDSGVKRFVKEIEKVKSFKKYCKVVKDIQPHLWDMLVEAHKPSEGVNTMKQGDPWVTNMMFKYDKDHNVYDIKIVDFQGTGYGSPVADVMFFLWSSATIDVKKNRLEDLYRIYVSSLNDNLIKFKCAERLTYEQLTEHVDKFKSLALFLSCCLMPCYRHPDAMALDVFFSTDDGKEAGCDKFYDKYYTEKYCEEFLPQVVETLEVNGVFSYLEHYKK